MASTNQSPFYKQAELKFLNAQTNEEKLKWLEEMIRECPKHKSSEKMLANLKTRYIKLRKKIATQKKISKGFSKKGIKKEDMQVIIVGINNTGKSSLISSLTNTFVKTAEYKFTTKTPEVRMINHEGIQMQLIEIPAIDSDYYDKGLVNTADTIVILITNLEQLKEIEPKLEKTQGKKIIVFNKIDLLNEHEKRKISTNLQSKKYNSVLVSAVAKEGFEELKEKIFKSFDKIRVYTKEPGKEKSQKPVILKQDSRVNDVAEKILGGFSKNIKETRIWGPSSKFPGQIVGLNHKLKDLDVVEFKIR